MDSLLLTRQAKATASEGVSLWASYLLLRNARIWMTILLVLADIASLLLAGTIAVIVRALLNQLPEGLSHLSLVTLSNNFQPSDYLKLFLLLLIFIGFYALRGLIPSIGVSPVEEFRRLSISTSMVALALASFAYINKAPWGYSRVVFGLTWFLALLLVPLGRAIVRGVAARAGLWGEPVAVLGYGIKGRATAEYLLKNPKLGLRPVVALNGFNVVRGWTSCVPLIQVGTLDRLKEASRLANVNIAILVISEVSEEFVDNLIEHRQLGYRRLITIPDLHQFGSLGVSPRDLGGVLGLEVQQNLSNVWQQMLKRILDLGVASIASLVLFPLFLLIAVLIGLQSGGKIFYGAIRLGKHGRKFRMWKFRTMVVGADQMLERYLNQHPELQSQWNASFKLKDDPRITKFGSFLRKSSLDEIPQFWNVLKGDMSLVGPRPIVDDEVKRYEARYGEYTRVRPGITGLWQISGRGDADYDRRVLLDDYYVRNWSIWLDIYILSQTPWAVLSRKGAY